MIKKILFIEPPYYRLYKNTYSLSMYPLSLGYLAGTVSRDTDWTAAVYNADFHRDDEPLRISHLTGAGYDNYLRLLREPGDPLWREIRLKIESNAPDVVGITCKSQNFASACVVARLVKEINPGITVIAGGPHPTMAGPAALREPCIDIIARGEGEHTITELLNELSGGRDFNKISGIAFRNPNGEIVETQPRAFIGDLDGLVFPNDGAPRALLDYSDFPKSAFGNVFATRGCPFHCFYCGSRELWSRRVRYRSPENVVREIKNIQKLGVDTVTFQDDTFGVTKSYITELCGAIEKNIPDLKWHCEIHVNLVDDTTIALMKRSGCRRVFIGVESGNNDVLKKIRKGFTIEKVYDAAGVIKNHGLELYAFFMAGFPWETVQTLNDTIAAMKKLKSDLLVYSIFTPYPGTEAFAFCKEHGLVDDDFDVSLYNHQSPANCFIMDMEPETFRGIMKRVEIMVDKKNSRRLLLSHISWDTLGKIRRAGIGGSVRRLVSLLRATGNR